MRGTIVACAVLLLAGCGGAGGGNDGTSKTRVSVSGNIKATAAKRDAPMAAMYAVSSDAAVDSPFSVLTGVDVSGRFPAISPGDIVVVETSVTNESSVQVDVVASAMIEDATFATPEKWSCMKCYPHSGGEYCNGLWETEGGTILVPMDPSPALAACDATTPEVSGYCVTVFPADADCASPAWRVEYEGPRDGLWRSEATASIQPGETWMRSVGYGNNAMDVRADHYARWVVRDQATGAILAGGQKDYAFDVVAP